MIGGGIFSILGVAKLLLLTAVAPRGRGGSRIDRAVGVLVVDLAMTDPAGFGVLARFFVLVSVGRGVSVAGAVVPRDLRPWKADDFAVTMEP